MKISREEAIRILTRYDNEYYTPETRQAHRMGIEALREQEERRWIPVTEPPKEKGRYWCNVESFSFPGEYYKAVLKWDDGFIEGNIYTDSVTHWMPLPDGPVEGE